MSRLPVVANLNTKDGVQNRNARLTNALKETSKAGDKAVVRPGLVLDAQSSGVGNGLVVYNNELVSVYGATVGVGISESASADVSYAMNIGMVSGGIIGNSGKFIAVGNQSPAYAGSFQKTPLR